METKKLHDIINDLTTTRDELSLNISDEIIFNNAVRIFIHHNIHNQIPYVPTSNFGVGMPLGEKAGVITGIPTPTQRRFLKRSGIVLPMQIETYDN